MDILKLEKYCTDKLLKFEIEEGVIEVADKLYSIIPDDSPPLFDEEFNFNLRDTDIDEDGWLYLFGGRYFIQKKGSSDIDFIELKNLGEPRQTLPTTSFLGIHSGYELMNGVGTYKTWVEKAKFLGCKALGICERNTLAGMLNFQGECLNAGIKPIMGISTTIKSERSTYDVKLYVRDFEGWINLLALNTILNVDKELEVEEELLRLKSNGLYIIADPKNAVLKDLPDFIKYYQLEVVEYLSEEEDISFLERYEDFLKSSLEPVAISDAFYPEEEDSVVREMLWNVAKSFDSKTTNQFFKSRDQYAKALISMFENKAYIKLFKEAIKNEAEIVENCNFTYDTNSRHLPRYVMTKEESEIYSSNEELFIALIKKGFKEKNIKDSEKYIGRLKEEIRVLKKGDVIDYFLSLYDIVRFAKDNNILTGIGRGSAGGSLVSYLLGLIQVDPLELNLLFERFLNDGRMGTMEDRPAYKIKTDEGEIILPEGSIVRVERDSIETILYIQELKEGDKILKV